MPPGILEYRSLNLKESRPEMSSLSLGKKSQQDSIEETQSAHGQSASCVITFSLRFNQLVPADSCRVGQL